MVTIEGAFATAEEDIKGSIEVGKLADMAMLSGDPFEVEPDDIKDINVLWTMVGGDLVYER